MIFDVGVEPVTRAPYIVMEYVPGQTLDKLLLSREDRKLPAEESLQLALEAGGGFLIVLTDKEWCIAI